MPVDDEFPGSPDALEPLLEHKIDMEGSRSLPRSRSGTPGLRLTVRAPQPQPPPVGEDATPLASPHYSRAHALALRPGDSVQDQVHEIEVEVLTEAVCEAVADAVGEVVHEAVQEAVQTALEESRFDFRANVFTFVAVTAAVLLERGIWNLWDMSFGDDTYLSNAGSLVVGIAVLVVIRILNLPLVSTVPGR